MTAFYCSSSTPLKSWRGKHQRNQLCAIVCIRDIVNVLRSEVIMERPKLSCRPRATNEIGNQSLGSKSIIHAAPNCPDCIRQLVQRDRDRRNTIRCECENKIPAPEQGAQPWCSPVGVTVWGRILKRSLAHALEVFDQRLVRVRVGAEGAQAAHDILKWTFELKTLCSLEFVRSQDGSQQRFNVAVGC